MVKINGTGLENLTGNPLAIPAANNKVDEPKANSNP